MICFKTGSLDASYLERQISVKAEDICRIGRYSALCRLTVDGNELAAFTLATQEAKRLENPSVVTRVIARMHGTYWHPREETLGTIAERINSALIES